MQFSQSIREMTAWLIMIFMLLMDAKGKLFATTLPSERIYNKWFVSVPAELLWVPGIANYKQEVGWSIDPEHAVLESVFISKTKERERENYKCHWRIKTQGCLCFTPGHHFRKKWNSLRAEISIVSSSENKGNYPNTRVTPECDCCEQLTAAGRNQGACKVNGCAEPALRCFSVG